VDLRRFLFRYRGVTPVPLIAASLALARPSRTSWFTGIAVMLIGEGVRLWGAAVAGPGYRITSAAAGDRLITEGPFSHVRNPLYCGNFLLWFGFLIAARPWMPWMALIMVLFFFFQYNRIVGLEEEYLTKKFGPSYDAYRNAVARWIPRLRPYRDGGGCGADWKRALRSERNTFQAIAAVLILVFLRWRLA
jgi:protein-S-isoprenylcysteine O-methyltransferase Ste14